MPRTIRLASRVSRFGSFCMEGTRAGGARSRAAWNAKPGRGFGDTTCGSGVGGIRRGAQELLFGLEHELW